MKDTIYNQIENIISYITTVGNGCGELFGMPNWSAWLISALLVLLFMFTFKWTRFNAIFRHRGLIAIIVWFLGLLLYMIGFCDGGTSGNPVALFARAALSSLEMFASHSDLVEVRHACHEDKVYMLLFSVVHLLAVLTSVLFIIKWIGFRFLSKVEILIWHVKNRLSRKKDTNTLYVFWGINDNAICLAKSIREDEENQLSRMIFVDSSNSSDDTHLSRFSFSHFFHSSHDRSAKYIDEIKKMDAVLLKAEHSFNNSSPTWFGNIIIGLFENREVKIYFLSNDEKANISAFIGLKEFAAFKADNLECFCHARKTQINESILESSPFKHRSHLIDSSSLAIQSLRTNIASHPVNFVEHQHGTVSHPFVGMVIGFGETGRDAFRFLYEYSSFVKSVCKGEDGIDEIEEQERKIYVVDEKLTSLKADFLAVARALNNDNSIEWMDVSTHCKMFADIVVKIVQELNYVIVAVNDDEEACSIATRLYKMAYSQRKSTNQRKLGIYVRIREKNAKEKFKIIADYFEKKNPNSPVSLYPFGDNEEIFTNKNINTDNIEKQAQVFFFEYAKKSAEIEKNKEELNRLSQTTAAEEWERRRANCNSSLEQCIKLFYQEDQDRSNAYHIYTKRILADLDMYPAEEARKKVQEDTALINVLGYCEHLRWNAKMKLMNFVLYEKDEEIESMEKNQKKLEKIKRYEHDCLLPCNNLIRGEQKDTFEYDRRVVELSVERMFDVTDKG